MGMFDYVRCNHILPDTKTVDTSEFQTKDMHCFLDNYIITESGRLYRQDRESIEYLDYTGSLEFYRIDESMMDLMIYKATFEQGWLKSIKRTQ